MDDESNSYLAAIAMIVEKDGKFLIGKRSLEKDYGGGIWEFPSGRFKQGETPEEAVRREGMEELGVHVEPQKIIDAYYFKRKGKDALLLLYICTIDKEPIIGSEHSELIWANPHEIKELFQFKEMYSSLEKFISEKR